MNDSLPPELVAFSSFLDAQPLNVRELFQYALTMLMVEKNHASIIAENTRDDGKHWFTFRTTAGDVFAIARPDVPKELLLQMMEMAREITDEENPGNDEETPNDL